MKFFRHKADRLPVALFLLAFAVDLLIYFNATALSVLVTWTIVGIFHKACICSFGHHHQHLPTFHQPILNRLLEIVYGFITGITSHAWFLHHVIGHHKNYLDQSKDQSAWKRPDGSTMGEVEYAFVIAGTGYPRAYKSGKDFPKHRRIFVTMLLVQLCLLGLLFAHNWVNALFVFLIPMMISLFITAWHTYYHHSGLDAEDDFHASYNITHKWYNILTGNLGYHTAHHIQGGLHWSKLPELHAKIADTIPEELIHEPCIPFRWMPAN
jgi:fatty acid desaturase